MTVDSIKAPLYSPDQCALFDTALFSRCKEAEAMRQAKQAAIDVLQQIIRESWGSATLNCFGSFATGVSVAFEDDVDISLSVELTDRTTGKPWEERGTLCALKKLLLSSGCFPPEAGSLALTLDARVPILSYYPIHKMTATDTEDSQTSTTPLPVRLLQMMRFDLCVNRTFGVLNSQLLRDYADCGSCKETVRAFLKAVRLWASSHRIVRPRDGFLNAYCVQLLAIGFLQRIGWLPNLQSLSEGDSQRHGGTAVEVGTEFYWRDPSSLKHDKQDPACSVLCLFAHFLHYYCVEFDWDTNAVCISADDASGMCERPVGVSSSVAAVCVLDPLEEGFNVARHLSPLHRTEIMAQMATDLARLHKKACETAAAAAADSYEFLFERI